MKLRIIQSFGVKIGKDCLILTHHFIGEPYLITVGDHVAIAGKTRLITHDGSPWVFKKEYPEMVIVGEIIIGDNTHIGTSCIILPNTRIGKNCIIGAGSVVRGFIPDNSVVMGNPAKVVMRTQTMGRLFKLNKHALDILKMTPKEKEAFVKKHFNLN